MIPGRHRWSAVALLLALSCLPNLKELPSDAVAAAGGLGGSGGAAPLSVAPPDAGPGSAADAGDAGCAAPECAPASQSFDDLFLAALSDSITLDYEARIVTRYLALGNRRSAGVCGEELERERRALFQLLNGLSSYFQIRAPRALDAEQTLYRIDLRDYGWDRPATLAGTQLGDGWEALISRVPSAVPFTGPQADDLAAGVGTRVPVLFADAFIAAASSGELYYALTGAPTTLMALLAALPVDVPANLTERTVQRAGVASSVESGLSRVVERHAFAAGRVYWQASDLATGSSVLSAPLGFVPESTLALYSLPNRMPAFFIADAAGNRQPQLTRGGVTLTAGVSCVECHAAGVLPVTDEVRAAVASNAGGLSAADVTRVNDLYVPASVLAQSLDGDRATFAAARDSALAAPCTGPCCEPSEPISAAVQRYQRPLALADALGDLGTTRAAFDAAAHLLDPRLAALREGGTLERSVFERLYVASVCVLASVPVGEQPPRNLPDLAVCEPAPPDAGAN